MGMSENETPNPYRRAKGIAFTVLGLGLAASVAGNIQSIYLDAPHGESPSVGAFISAVWWPGILFLMIEIAIHTPWAKTSTDRVVQWLGAGVIGALAFYISYFHLAHVLSSFGYDTASRYVGPLAIDTAMMVATYALRRISLATAEAQLAAEVAMADMAKAQEMAKMATEMAKDLATPEVATAPEPVATVATEPAAGQEADLATDWADLEGDLDRELAEMTEAAAARAAAGTQDEEPAAEPEPATDEASQERQEEAPAVRLTTVPALAAKRIQEALDGGATKDELTALDEALAAEGIAGSTRTARRWRAAVANQTARVS